MTLSNGRHDRAADEWDRYGTQWIRKRPQMLWRRHSDAVNARLLERWLPAAGAGRVLKTDLFDEAVSAGLHDVIAPRASEVVGLDLSRSVIDAARDRHPSLDAVECDVRRLPFADEVFDTVVSLSTLDHFETHADIDVAMSEMARVMKRGATLILTLDNSANPVVAIRNALPFALTHRLGLVPYPVGRTHDSAGAVKAVERAGLEVKECTSVMHAPRVMAIPVMNAFGRIGSEAEGLMSRMAMSFERLGHFPTGRLTGHFVAIRALRAC